jgi:glycosyltransferase involved in cell wall biosynthesis
MQLSVVVPIHNEEHSILPLYDRLSAVLRGMDKSFEIVFVDDASSDSSFELLANLVETDMRVRVVRLRRNFGQTAALAAGFDEAKGEIIVSMDGDLQHAPEDLPRLVGRLEEGYDVASGWRVARVDNLLLRKIPSRIANWMMAKVSGVDLHDFGTTFKAYRAEILKDVKLYGELHRFIPALAALYGARVVEVPISNSDRNGGASHYGIGRTFNVMFDIITIRFLLKYVTRPMHLFGRLGLLSGVSGGLMLTFILVKKLLGQEVLLQHGPLMIAGTLLVLSGLLLLCTGLLGEMLMRTYFESQGRRIYAIREIRSRAERAKEGSR